MQYKRNMSILAPAFVKPQQDHWTAVELAASDKLSLNFYAMPISQSKVMPHD